MVVLQAQHHDDYPLSNIILSTKSSIIVSPIHLLVGLTYSGGFGVIYGSNPKKGDVRMNYIIPKIDSCTSTESFFTSSIAQQYVTFNLDQSSCRSDGPVLHIVNSVTHDCVDPSQFAIYLSRDTTFTCQGDATTYQLLTTNIVVGGNAPCSNPAIRTLSFPQGAPEGTCVVETFIIPDLGGNVCE